MKALDDTKIIDLFFERDETAIRYASEKYGNRLRSLSHSIVKDRQTDLCSAHRADLQTALCSLILLSRTKNSSHLSGDCCLFCVIYLSRYFPYSVVFGEKGEGSSACCLMRKAAPSGLF